MLLGVTQAAISTVRNSGASAGDSRRKAGPASGRIRKKALANTFQEYIVWKHELGTFKRRFGISVPIECPKNLDDV